MLVKNATKELQAYGGTIGLPYATALSKARLLLQCIKKQFDDKCMSAALVVLSDICQYNTKCFIYFSQDQIDSSKKPLKAMIMSTQNHLHSNRKPKHIYELTYIHCVTFCGRTLLSPFHFHMKLCASYNKAWPCLIY